jgi:competence protein ComEA
MPRRVALALLLCVVLAAPVLRRLAETPAPPRACVPEGRGTAPRHHLGCAADPGPGRALVDDERLLLGLPLDPNVASARGLAFVPGLSRRLAAEIVRNRAENGPFSGVDDLTRVRGIGPKRLAQARPHLAGPSP